MRAVIERAAAPATDGYGGPGPLTWQPHATVPCFAWHPTSRARAFVVDGEKHALLADLMIALAPSAAVGESDRVARIEDRRDAVLYQGPYSIVAPLKRRTGYVEARLERVS